MRNVLLLAAAAAAAAAAPSTRARGLAPRARNLAPRALRPLPLGRTVPSGWLRSQLDAQQAGLCGRGWLSGGVGTAASHANDSAWVAAGGVSSPYEESWPYWANGAIPLAVLTQDAPRLAQLRSMVDHILAVAARPGGWLGPASGRGHWSAARGATALAQWAEATGDGRIVPALVAFSGQLAHQLQAHPLHVGSPGEGSWAGARWVEYVAVFEWLLDQPQQLTAAQREALHDLIALLEQQGLDWNRWVFSDERQPFVPPGVAAPPQGQWWQLLHGYALRTATGSEGCTQHCHAIPLPRGLPVGGGASNCSAACEKAASCVGWSVVKDTSSSGRHGKGALCQLFEAAAMAGSAPFYIRDPNFDCGSKKQLQPTPPSRPPPGPPGPPPPPPPHTPTGFSPWFPNNTQDAEAIANNLWLPQMSQMLTHGVNLAQAMHVWGVMFRYTNDSAWLSRGRDGWQKVLRLHGQPTGVFSGWERYSFSQHFL